MWGMTSYILRRLLLIIPTLLGIMVINFAIIQIVPGGPVERMIAQMTDITSMDATSRISGAGGAEAGAVQTMGAGRDSIYQGARQLDPEIIERLNKQYGFDKPVLERFVEMMLNYLTFDFGESYFRGGTVVSLIVDTLPVTISLGLWTTLIIYLISIPLGIRKAVKDGTNFDVWSSMVVTIGYAVPAFLFAMLLVILFAGGNYVQWFPLRGLTSDNWEEMSMLGKVVDYFWHITLPLIAMVLSGFASLTMLTKNCFLDEINKQYVVTARAKGLGEKQVLYGHVFRNAMLIIISGFPAALLGILFTSSLVIEIIFSLNGLGLLGFEAIIHRDYPVILATAYIFSLLGLLIKLLGDLVYMWVDPRIDFERRAV